MSAGDRLDAPVAVTFVLERPAREALDAEVALRRKEKDRHVSRSEVLREYVDMGLDLDRDWRKDNADG